METNWSGLFFDVTQMPAGCYLDPEMQPALRPCTQPTVASPGPMRLVAHVYEKSSNGLWPSVSDPIEVGKDFVYGADKTVEVPIE